jgi:hypothetical protein
VYAHLLDCLPFRAREGRTGRWAVSSEKQVVVGDRRVEEDSRRVITGGEERWWAIEGW